MGLAGYIIGGALQGLGAGMALKQKSEDEDRRAELAERRAIAMENLKSQNMGNRELASDDRRSQADAESDARDAAAKKAEMAQRYGYEGAIASAGTAAKDRDREDTQRHEERMARINGAIDTNKEIARIAAQAEADGRLIQDIRPDANGNPVVYYKGGKREHVKTVREAPKASSAGSDWLSGTGPAKPGAAPSVLNATRDKDGNYIIQ